MIYISAYVFSDNTFIKRFRISSKVHNLEHVEPHQRCPFLLQTCYDEKKSDFVVEVQDTLAYQHGLCIKNEYKFNAPMDLRL